MIGFYCNNPRGWIAIRACITLLLTPSTELFLGELNLLITDMSQGNCWVTVHDEQVEGDGGGGGSMTAHGRLGAAKIIWTREDWGGGLRVWSSHHCRERPQRAPLPQPPPPPIGSIVSVVTITINSRHLSQQLASGTHTVLLPHKYSRKDDCSIQLSFPMEIIRPLNRKISTDYPTLYFYISLECSCQGLGCYLD